MSANLEFVFDRNLFKSNSKNFFHDRESSSKSKRGYRLKENICKARYHKTLKRKLKKYKLRRNGDEDQDILDMSNILYSVLRIKSPNKLQDMSDSACERPVNYLAKASKQKQRMDASTCLDFGLIEIKQENHTNHLSATKSNLENERKEKNAFQLMMDSRGTSIGQNSHGQEINFVEIEQQENIEIKNVKAKRKLILQKMAVAKGSLKNKEREYFQEQYIKVKMDKRAERLKNMIEKSSSTVEKTGIKTPFTTSNDKYSVSSVQCESSVIESQPKTLKLINIFCDPMLGTKVKTKPDLSKEDKEFLKKLSPSIKKKENMLSYFDKIDTKSSESNRDVDSDVKNKSSIIKVKFTSRNSKKVKKKKLSLIKQKCETSNMLEDRTQNDDNMLEKNDCKSMAEDKTEVINESLSHISQRKRKRYENSNAKCVQPSDNENFDHPELTGYSRSKRNVKRPIKYIDDVELSSSDDEPQIFTPKKKKVLLNTKLDKHVPNISVKPHKNSSKYSKQLDVKKQLDKNIKLAPIFQKKPPMSEATKNFLHSGLPDQIKKIASKLSKKINDEKNMDVFHAVVHIRQNGMEKSNTILPPLNLLDEKDSSDENIQYSCYDFGKLLKISNTADASYLFAMPNCNINVLLQNIKQSYPKFPVYRTYRSLKAKCLGEIKDSKLIDSDSSMEMESDTVIDVKNENPDYLNWSNKYRPRMSNQILGNFENIKELKKWLISRTENEISVKTIKNVESDSSNYYESDSDSRDSMKSTSNLLILSGPVGSGKTSSVYAVAAELAIKVIEVNVSSKRTGKIMLQDLKEATQSHKVNRGKGSNLENSQKSQEVIKYAEPKTYSRKKRGRPKKVIEKCKNTPTASAVTDEVRNQFTSQENTRTGISLILIDDADIVFDQDEGFRCAVSQLIHCSKRPVILVTTSLTCQHLQKFVQCGKIISMKPFLPKMLGTWLDLMCLADSGCCIPGLGAQFLDYYSGDIRKTINILQFYISTQSVLTKDENIIKLQNDDYKDIVEDESSSTSWKDSESLEEAQKESKVSTNMEKIVWQCFIEKRPYSMELFNVWWSLPILLNFSSEPEVNVDDKQLENIKNKKNNLSEMQLVACVLDNFSLSDCISYKRPNNEINIYSTPWLCKEEDGLDQIENIDNFRGDYEISDDIICSLTTTSIGQAQKMLNCEWKTHGSYPSLTVQRERDRIISRHKNLTNDLNVSSSLDRRALALDYWPSCRAICRVEKAKTVNNSKRNNRFCHYLKSLKAMSKNDTYDNLADSLCSKDNSGQICVVTK